MLNHQSIVRLLLEKGGKDSAKCECNLTAANFTKKKKGCSDYLRMTQTLVIVYYNCSSVCDCIPLYYFCVLAHTYAVCRDPFSRFSRITSLLMEAERELDHLKCELVTQNVGGNSKVKEDLQRRLREWEWKARLLRKMKNNYEEASELFLATLRIEYR